MSFLRNPSFQVALKDSPIYPLIQVVRFQQWSLRGRPVPPPNVVKQRTVREYARQFHLDTLIETGTFWGDMISASKRYFRRILSVELSDYLHEKAKKRFAKQPHVELVLGDSGLMIRQILAALNTPALFWLDAHAMGTPGTSAAELETPIVQEIQQVLNHPIKQHVVLVDDARFFNGEHDYPTLDQFEAMVRGIRPDIHFDVRDDIIRLTPSNTA